jgi:hypothetical protein
MEDELSSMNCNGVWDIVEIPDAANFSSIGNFY